MANMITRCPKCATAFHITDTHLKSANGSVRCGSCLTVFNGADNLTHSEQDTHATEQELLISDNMDPSHLGDNNATKDGKHVERRKKPRTPKTQEPEPVDEDESWALKLLEEEGHDPAHIGLVETPEETEPDKTDDVEPEPSEEITTGEASEQPQQNIPEPTPDTEVSAPTNEQNEPAAQKTNKDLLGDFEPDALEVEVRKERRFWSSRILWLFLILIGTAALIAQIGWMQFDILSRKQPYRQVYELACQHLKCTLPELIDRKAIKTSNLVIQTHPTTENALMIDVILKNEAEFEQTFPNLVLTFSDLDSKVIAKRAFTPDDYLGGELAGIDLMPKNQPIHIGIEIVDPGKGAVSYDIYVSD